MSPVPPTAYRPHAYRPANHRGRRLGAAKRAELLRLIGAFLAVLGAVGLLAFASYGALL